MNKFESQFWVAVEIEERATKRGGLEDRTEDEDQ